jgi:hypothetical protein
MMIAFLSGTALGVVLAFVTIALAGSARRERDNDALCSRAGRLVREHQDGELKRFERRRRDRATMRPYIGAQKGGWS